MNPKNQNFSIFLAGFLILLIGIGIGYWWGRAENVRLEIPVVQNEKASGTNNFVGAYKVTRVIDGDTIEIEGGEKVRYIGIDTPETVDPDRPVECFGPEATQKNKELVEGQTVRLEKDTTNRDKYNRLLRYVYVGTNFINLELVKLGFAKSVAYPPDLQHQSEFSAAQIEAQKSNLGLWKACSQK